jgi:hypothetical protein
MYLDTQFDIKGFWWLPDNPDNKLSGVLSCFQNGRIELDLMGTFFENPLEQKNLPVMPLVLGISDKGKPVTLVHSIYLNWNLNFPGIAKSRILAKFLLVGAHISNASELTFSQITFRTFGLDEWLGISGFIVNHNLENKTFDIHFAPPSIIEYKVLDDISLSIRFSWSGPSFGPLNSVEMTHKAYLRLEFTDEKGLEELLGLVHRTRNFLNVAIGQPISLREISIGKPSIKRMVGRKEQLESIDVYYQSIPSIYPKGAFYRQEMIVPYQDIKDQLGVMIKNWLSMYKNLEPAINLYFAILHNEELYIDNKFLGLIQGLETYHRLTSDNQSVPQKEHQKRISSILDVTPTQYRDWLKEKLNYSNEPSLRVRIKELIQPFHNLFGTNNNRKTLIAKIVDTRNYLTHYDQRLKAKAAHGADLFPLNQKLQALFILHLLLELGFNKEKINNIITTNPKLQNMLDSSIH